MCPTFFGQKQFVAAFNDPKPAGYAHPKTETTPLKIDTQKINWGKRMALRIFPENLSLIGPDIDFLKSKFWKK